jgi:hypothetical protein
MMPGKSLPMATSAATPERSGLPRLLPFSIQVGGDVATGSFRTLRIGLTMSAVEGRTDMSIWRGHFRL